MSPAGGGATPAQPVAPAATRWLSSAHARQVEVFGVDHRDVQVTWRAITGGPIEVRAGDRSSSVDRDTATRPGACTLVGVTPRSTRLTVARADEPPLLDQPIDLLLPPPGPELHRLATVSDLHVGSDGFGRKGRLHHDPTGSDPHPRCARAAIGEARQWGAHHLVVKGDLTHHGGRRAWNEVGAMLHESGLEVHTLPGNHDAYPVAGRLDPYHALDPFGITMTVRCSQFEVPGLSVILANTTYPHKGRGRVWHIEDEVCDLAADARRAGLPLLLCLHHHANPQPIQYFWPNGIPKPEAERFARRVRSANPATLVTSGHTHRHRRRRVGGLTWTEVGSPKDYPGTWAGYIVFEGGIIQTVRRVADPDAMAWTEYTRRAAHGLWGFWSPGRPSDRCFTHLWDPAVLVP